MNVLSLFSGVGGLELGLERAGIRLVEAGGNAVVPQIAEHIGRMILAADATGVPA